MKILELKKNTITNKNSLDMLNSRMEMTKKMSVTLKIDQYNDLSLVQIDLYKLQILWENNNRYNSVLWKNNNRYNIHEIGIPEGKEKDFIAGKNIFKEIKAEKIPNLKKGIHLQVQETE